MAKSPVRWHSSSSTIELSIVSDWWPAFYRSRHCANTRSWSSFPHSQPLVFGLTGLTLALGNNISCSPQSPTNPSCSNPLPLIKHGVPIAWPDPPISVGGLPAGRIHPGLVSGSGRNRTVGELPWPQCAVRPTAEGRRATVVAVNGQRGEHLLRQPWSGFGTGVLVITDTQNRSERE